ncbi:hypothetical protein MBANPS3_005780 [Mucor bainieri]
MGVFGAWGFLFEKKVNVEICSNLGYNLNWREKRKKIHIDLVGAFYDDIRRFFIHCDKNDSYQKTMAARKFLNHLAELVPKNKCILYINGGATEEQSQRIEEGINSHLELCKQLELDIDKYNNSNPTEMEMDNLLGRISNIFRFTHDLPSIFYEVAREQGWDIVRGNGEAQVAIGKEGGIAVSGDSDMLFYPNVGTIIRPLDVGQDNKPRYQVYHKSSILSALGLSNDAFTALGILAANGYDANHTLPPDASTQQLMKAYIAKMNARTGESAVFEDYVKSYRIFVLQEEHLQPLYDVQSNGLHTAAHYMKQLK